MMARQKVRQHHEVIPATASTPEILVVRSSRRRRTVSAQPQEDGSIRLLVPGASTDAQIREYLESLIPRVQRKQRETSRRRRIFASDDYLTERARALAARHLSELVPEKFPNSIRWVSNQRKRWGSATPTQGTIRISDDLQGAPEYVVDSVIYHELCHFVELHHNARFRTLEARFPDLDKARAFLGVWNLYARKPPTKNRDDPQQMWVPKAENLRNPQSISSAGITHEMRCASLNRPQCLMCDYEAWRVMY